MSSLQLPQVCGVCGKAKAQDTWNITSKVKKLSAVSAATIFVGVTVSNVHTYTFPVAICDKCKHQLEQDASWKKWGTIIVGLIVVASFMDIMLTNKAETIFGIVFLVSLALLVLIRLMFTRELGSFNGDYFKFTNKTYQAEFASLNPELVKQKRR